MRLGVALPELAAEDDDGLRPRLRREALLEEVLRLLGLDARDGEVVLELAAGGHAAADHGGHREHDGECREARTAPDEGGEMSEESGHERTVHRLRLKINYV